MQSLVKEIWSGIRIKILIWKSISDIYPITHTHTQNNILKHYNLEEKNLYFHTLTLTLVGSWFDRYLAGL